jgi:hypothetical protein
MTSIDDALRRARHEQRIKLRLTDRWTPLIPHEMQSLYFWSPVRFKINPSGRRSGKTENAKRKGVVKHLIRRSKHPVNILFGAPTFGQARDIFWDDLKALIPDHWKAYVSETRLEIKTHWGYMVRVFGFDRPRRVEGVIWDWMCIDEVADCPAKCFQNNIRPALSTRGREGGADLIGVPDEVGRNQVEYEELWERGLRWKPDEATAEANGGDHEICSYWWPSSDIITTKETESAKRGMDALAHQQEYDGRFVRSGGKVLPYFDVKLHVSEDFTSYAPGLPIDWPLDFGTRWCASLIGQVYRGHMWVMDEIAIQDSSTDVASKEFYDRCQSRGYSLRRLRVFGDAAGNSAHSNTGESDYEILEDRLNRYGVKEVDWMQLRAAPAIKDTVNAVRGRVATADGFIHLHVHPRCVHLIENMKTAPWPDGSNGLKDYHWLAALRYWCYTLFGEEDNIAGTSPLSLPSLGG